jgi:hypothetical protein
LFRFVSVSIHWSISGPQSGDAASGSMPTRPPAMRASICASIRFASSFVGTRSRRILRRPSASRNSP